MTPRAHPAARERGVALVEMAIILTSTILLIPVVFLFGRLLYQYSVLKQATNDAAAYVATVPALELQDPAAAAVVLTRAETMLREAVSAAGIRPDASLAVLIDCDDNPCGVGTPGTVRVRAVYQLDVSLFETFYTDWVGYPAVWNVAARSTYPYTN